MTARKILIVKAMVDEILPDVMGRSFFSGCNLSLDLSIRSFIIYTEDDSRQNITKPLTDSKALSKFRTSPANTKAANRIKFFIHCNGLKELKIADSKLNYN